MKQAILILVLLLAACMQANPSNPSSSNSGTPAEKPTEETTEVKPPDDNQVMCTQDAMQCADGSWVGRSGPDCQFACPAAPAK